MGLVTVVLSIGAAIALTLVMIYGASWVLDRRLVPHLFFGILAIVSAIAARCELGMMHSAVAENGEWLRFAGGELGCAVGYEVLRRTRDATFLNERWVDC